jgi:glycosyltransferase involved in cell wall biosynthesis
VKILISMTEPFIVRSLLKGHLKWLVNQGHSVTVVCGAGGDVNWILEQGVMVSIVSIERRPSILKDIKCLIEMIFILRRLRPDIIHYSTPKSSLITPMAVFLGRLKAGIIYTVRGRVYENKIGIKRWLFELADKFSCWVASKVIFISKEIKDDFVKHEVVEDHKALLIGLGSSNGFDTNVFRKPTVDERNEAKDYFQLERSANVITYVGRLALDKGADDLFRVFETIAEYDPLMNFLVIGKVEIQLESLLKKYSIDSSRLFFHDWCADIHKAYWASDVTVFPSFREGFGNVCVESILCGSPVVCYDVVGCRESVKQGISGYKVPFRNTQAMVDKIVYLFEDSDRREVMVAKGTEWATISFNQEVIWDGIQEVYASSVSGIRTN